MITTNTFKNLFNDFAEQHYNIHTFSDGKLYDISTENTNYPMLFYFPGTEETIGGMERFRFKLFLADLLNHDKSNSSDITSDLQLTKRDIIGSFNAWAKEYGIYLTQSVMTSFGEGYDDNLTVLEIDFNVEYGNKINCLLTPKENL